MKVSRDSWHYKILMDEHKLKTRNGVSLCLYFWMVVFNIFAWCLIGVLAPAVACVFLGIVYLTGYVWYFMVAGWFGVGSFDTNAIEMSFIINSIFLVIWIFSMFVRYNNKEKDKQKSSDNLFVEYVKAKKRKVCPLIEVE